jgi:predicted ribosome quality control (RQC) complex YloA/Tae2 family protein
MILRIFLKIALLYFVTFSGRFYFCWVGKMSKNRFTAVDVRAVVSNLRATCVGMRVANIYDLSPKTYMFKLAEPGKDKQLLLIESGIRVHTTKYARQLPKVPSIFALKLRKHVRSKRLVSIEQLGIDRVIDFTFGTEEFAYHIIVELHSKGNVILADYQYNIITLLRTFKYKDTGT